MGTVRYTVVNGEVLSENRDGVKRDYLPDTQGNTIGLLDNTQTITDTFSYYPYGEVASRTGTTATPFQFLGTLGYYRDSASRTYVRARTLNTAQGRWMTQDPIGFKGGDYNIYRYVANRPTVLTDSSGLGVPCTGQELELCERACAQLPFLGVKNCVMYPELGLGSGGLYPTDCSCYRKDYKDCVDAAVNRFLKCMASATAANGACVKGCRLLGGLAGYCFALCFIMTLPAKKKCLDQEKEELKKCKQMYPEVG